MENVLATIGGHFLVYNWCKKHTWPYYLLEWNFHRKWSQICSTNIAQFTRKYCVTLRIYQMPQVRKSANHDFGFSSFYKFHTLTRFSQTYTVGRVTFFRRKLLTSNAFNYRKFRFDERKRNKYFLAKSIYANKWLSLSEFNLATLHCLQRFYDQ